ncbi:E3 ubiquitin-protein ligase RNF14, partial [Mucuna pruriens]
MEETHYSSETESTGFSAPTASIEVAEKRHQDSTDAKAQYLASAQNSSKRKSPLDHDHCDAKKKSSQPSRLLLCHICFDYKPVSDMFKHGKCNHQFCTLCITKHVATKIHQNILKVICPSPNCSVELEPEHFLHTILPSEVIGRWECARCESLIVASEKSYCPFKDCSVLLVNDGGEVVTSAECPSCHRLFCAQCKVPWHGNMTCEEFQANSDGKELDNKFFKLARRKNWQKCPQCTMFVQKHSVDATSAMFVARIGSLDMYARSVGPHETGILDLSLLCFSKPDQSFIVFRR